MDPLLPAEENRYTSFGPKEPGCCTSLIQKIFFCCCPQEPDRNYSMSSRGSSVSSKRSFLGSFTRQRAPSTEIPYVLFEDLEVPQLSENAREELWKLGIDPTTPTALATTLKFFLKSNQHMIRTGENYCYIPIIQDELTCVILLPNKEVGAQTQVVEINIPADLPYHEKLDAAIKKAIELGDNLVLTTPPEL